MPFLRAQAHPARSHVAGGTRGDQETDEGGEEMRRGAQCRLCFVPASRGFGRRVLRRLMLPEGALSPSNCRVGRLLDPVASGRSAWRDCEVWMQSEPRRPYGEWGHPSRSFGFRRSVPTRRRACRRAVVRGQCDSFRRTRSLSPGGCCRYALNR